MWDTNFDEAMLDRPVIIHCPQAADAELLFSIFQDHSIRWAGREPMSDTKWQSDVCYRVVDGIIRFGSRAGYEDDYAYDGYIRCTFSAENYMVSASAHDISDSDFDSIIAIGKEA